MPGLGILLGRAEWEWQVHDACSSSHKATQLSKSTICHSLEFDLPGSPRMDSPLIPSGSGNLASTRYLRLLPANWLWGSR